VVAATETHHEGVAVAVVDFGRGTMGTVQTHGRRGHRVSHEAARSFWEAWGGGPLSIGDELSAVRCPPK
jgi:hypothetical protein